MNDLCVERCTFRLFILGSFGQYGRVVSYFLYPGTRQPGVGTCVSLLIPEEGILPA